MALLANSSNLASLTSNLKKPRSLLSGSPPFVSFVPKIPRLTLRAVTSRSDAIAPAVPWPRSPLVRGNSTPRTRVGALKEGRRSGKKSRRFTVKTVVICAMVCVAAGAVGSCIVLVLLKYSLLPEGSPFVETVRSAKDWITSAVTLDDRTRWIIWDKADSAFDFLKTVSGTVLLAWVQLIPLIWLHYQHQKSGFADPAKKRQPVIQKVSFNDVEGVGAAKEELQEIVACLQGSTSYDKLGAEPPRGTLLVGPPGTGKTLLARAVAGEAGVPFFSASASEFVEVFVGRGAARVRDLFKEARKHEPSIVFIDELDAVGGKRGRSFNDEHDQTLIQLLTEMDGFETGSKVIVMAATNRPETLDSALCRPGRFSRKVFVGKPDLNGRKKILAVHLRGVPLEDDIQETCDLVAEITPSLVGADLANIVKEAVLLAARRGADAVSREDILKGVERAKFGIENRQEEETTKDILDGHQGRVAVSGLYG